jgi:hypothetical protein
VSQGQRLNPDTRHSATPTGYRTPRAESQAAGGEGPSYSATVKYIKNIKFARAYDQKEVPMFLWIGAKRMGYGTGPVPEPFTPAAVSTFMGEPEENLLRRA